MRDNAYTFVAHNDGGPMWQFTIRSSSAALAWLKAVLHLADELGVEFHGLVLLGVE